MIRVYEYVDTYYYLIHIPTFCVRMRLWQNNVYVSMQRAANNAARKIINALPDGYPIPMERTYRDHYMDRFERRY